MSIKGVKCLPSSSLDLQTQSSAEGHISLMIKFHYEVLREQNHLSYSFLLHVPPKPYFSHKITLIPSQQCPKGLNYPSINFNVKVRSLIKEKDKVLTL